MQRRCLLSFAALMFLTATAAAGDITLSLPADVKVTAATATPPNAEKLAIHGAVSGSTVTFAGAQPGMSYDIRLTLANGQELRGADLRWYSPEPAKPDAGPLTDDDRAEMQGICNVPSFYNRCEMLKLEGNHDRAAVLVQLVRDSDFHAGKGEIIWRAEVWYFKFQAGGWEKVNQQSLLLDRRRFKNGEEYGNYVSPLRFLPSLGGIIVTRDKPQRQVTLSAEEIASDVAPMPRK